MRRILPILIVVTALLTPLYPVYAQNNLPPRPVKNASPAGTLVPVMMQKAQGISDQMSARKEMMASKAAELRLKLQKFRDKNKAKRVENINDNLNTVNTNITLQMQKNLTHISEVVTKVKSWIAQQEAAGKDVSALKTTLSSLESQWSSANTAVTAQMGKDYTVVVNSETTVKADAQTARNTLRTDLKTLHDQIASLRQGLMSAFSSWKGVSNGQ